MNSWPNYKAEITMRINVCELNRMLSFIKKKHGMKKLPWITFLSPASIIPEKLYVEYRMILIVCAVSPLKPIHLNSGIVNGTKDWNHSAFSNWYGWYLFNCSRQKFHHCLLFYRIHPSIDESFIVQKCLGSLTETPLSEGSRNINSIPYFCFTCSRIRRKIRYWRSVSFQRGWLKGAKYSFMLCSLIFSFFSVII